MVMPSAITAQCGAKTSRPGGTDVVRFGKSTAGASGGARAARSREGL